MAIIRELRCVDEVIAQVDMDKLKIVKKIHADVVFVGSDWKGSEAWKQYEKEFATVGCTVVYIDHTDGISSTILRKYLSDGKKTV